MASRCSPFLPEDDCDSQDRHLLGDNYPHNATSDSKPSLSIINKELDVSSMGEITLYEDRNEHCEERYSLPTSPETGHRNRQCFSPVLFLSTLWVVTAASGLATALLVWIYLHGTQRSIDEIWREGAFLLDEGTHLDGGFPASRLMGLTISSASSIAMGTVPPILLSVYAYRSAHLWLRAGVMESLTPHEYGLMMESLGAAGIVSLSSTGQFLLRPSNRRRLAAYMLKEVFCVSVLAYALAHAVGGLDLWLHTAAATVTKEVDVEHPESFIYGITQTMCVSSPYPPTAKDSNGSLLPPCNLPVDPYSIKGQAVEIISNISSIAVAFPANSSGVATLMIRNTSVPTDAIFQMTTFGAKATCTSFNEFCLPPTVVFEGNAMNYVVGACNDGPSNFPVNITEDDVENVETIQDGMKPIISFPSGATDNSITTFTDLIGYPSNITQPGPYVLWLQFWFYDDGSILPSEDIFAFGGSYGMILATCNVSYYNVTIEYRNGVYNTIDEVPTARFLSDGFSGALRAGIYNDILLDDLKPIFSTVNATREERMALLTQEMTMMAAASAGIIANVTAPPLRQYIDRTLGRYPIYPVISLITLLYINSAFALVICILTATSRASRTKVLGTTGNISVLDLARLHLTSPLSLIADLCRLLDTDPNGERASIETMNGDIFDDKLDKRRIRVGLQDDENGKAVFRMWIERDDEVFINGNKSQ